MWTPPVADAWAQVLSFAMMVVVERTVESWCSTHGTSLSEVSCYIAMGGGCLIIDWVMAVGD